MGEVASTADSALIETFKAKRRALYMFAGVNLRFRGINSVKPRGALITSLCRSSQNLRRQMQARLPVGPVG